MSPAVRVPIADREAMAGFAARLADVCRAGDVIILTGDLGAGKTTLTQFLARGLDVAGRVSSPTFVIARTHPNRQAGRPALVHVDAYRLGDAAEFGDLDLDGGHEEAVTVIEWGRGLAESLAADRLEILITRAGETGPPGEQEAEHDPAGEPLDHTDDPLDPSGDPFDLTGAGEDESRTLTLIPTGPSWSARVDTLIAELDLEAR